MTRIITGAMERNRDAVLGVFEPLVPLGGTVLEVGSGPGAHGAFFNLQRPDVTWRYSDLGDRFDSVDAWREYFGLPNGPKEIIDLLNPPNRIAPCDSLFCMNTIHIAPSACVAGLFSVGAASVNVGGVVFLYGPFRFRSVPLEPSNARFDDYLRSRFPDGGIREFESVVDAAKTAGFAFEGRAKMPANNWSLWFRRDADVAES